MKLIVTLILLSMVLGCSSDKKQHLLPNASVWVVLNQHEDGKYLWLDQNGKHLNLKCTSGMFGEGCYAYQPGETIVLEKWCDEYSIPTYVKKKDDGTGEYDYTEIDVTHTCSY